MWLCVTTEFWSQLSSIEAGYLRQSSSFHCATSLASRRSYLQPSIVKQIARLREKTARWKHTSEHLSIGSKMIGQGYCQWRNLPTTMPRMPALVTHFSSSIVATTPESLMKKMLTPTRDLALLTS